LFGSDKEDAMAAPLRIILPMILLLGGVTATAARAQSEVERERRSLRGIDGFYLSLNTVGDAAVQDSLDFDHLHQGLRARLQEAGLPVWPEDRAAAENRVPYLHVHVNTVHAGRGLYPFGIEIRFYQAVRLERDAATPIIAATWTTSIVGVASYDHLGIIPEVTLGLLEEFIDDWVNTP
jgi:hypothetical protein